MKVDIGKYEFSTIWDGIYYHALSNYPDIYGSRNKDIWEWSENVYKFIDTL